MKSVSFAQLTLSHLKCMKAPRILACSHSCGVVKNTRFSQDNLLVNFKITSLISRGVADRGLWIEVKRIMETPKHSYAEICGVSLARGLNLADSFSVLYLSLCLTFFVMNSGKCYWKLGDKTEENKDSEELTEFGSLQFIYLAAM